MKQQQKEVHVVTNIKYIVTEINNPYHNLALEEYLLNHIGDTECILYLWQNEKTVVIGRNQNPWKECKISELEADGGKLIRRLSGGGAVFHDLGNLNFTFLVSKENYDVKKQLEVIVKAVNHLGIPAAVTGRNDITVDGRKFSGNAFYSDGVHNYHHGTILVDVDMSRMSHYLNVSKDKLISKGVESVRSRVMNLKEYKADLSIEEMKEELILAFGEVYDLPPVKMEPSQVNPEEMIGLQQKFSSWDWNLGRKMEFSDSVAGRFSWGDADMKLLVDAGIIMQCIIYSDALETGLFETIKEKLTGCPFTKEAMTDALKKISVSNSNEVIINDIVTLFK